jgi:signal transduction histidine kinase/CheY-like chemotaxis protein
MCWESEESINLLNSKRDWLTEHIHYVLKNNLSNKLYDALQPDCSESVFVLIDTLVGTCRSSDLTSTQFLLNNFSANDFVVDFNKIYVQFESLLKKSLPDLFLVLKVYRQAFLDLMDVLHDQAELNQKYRIIIERFFDRIELIFLADSNADGRNTKVSERVPHSPEILKTTTMYPGILDHFYAPIMLFDHQDKVLIFNQEAQKLVAGLKIDNNEEPVGTINECMVKIFQQHLTEFRTAIQNDSSYITSFITKTGERKYKILLKKIKISELCSWGTLVILQDITEQMETELRMEKAINKAEDADKLKTAFLANMSHEIRTPMNAILGFTELMLNEKFENSDRTEYLKLVRKSSNDLLNIIEDIIDIAKIESKQMKIKYKPCRPYEMMSDLKAVFSETLHRFGTNLNLELVLQVDESDQNLMFYTDGERLKQVVSNLLNNAVKFTDHGSIKFGYRQIDQSNIFFFVRDTGVGIPDNMKEKIFERFFQMGKTKELRAGGSGLGLAICMNIIQLLGGKIWVDSIEGEGSSFFFRIPCREVPKFSSEGVNEIIDIHDFPDWSDKQFLIAEDDEFNFILLREIFSKTRVKILRAKTGLEAINTAETEDKLDLILMDIKMPEVDGLEAAKYILSIRPNLPIIAQTAYAMEGDMSMCTSAGCCAYITKPVDRQKLFQLIQGNLKLKERFGNDPQLAKSRKEA